MFMRSTPHFPDKYVSYILSDLNISSASNIRGIPRRSKGPYRYRIMDRGRCVCRAQAGAWFLCLAVLLVPIFATVQGCGLLDGEVSVLKEVEGVGKQNAGLNETMEAVSLNTRVPYSEASPELTSALPSVSGLHLSDTSSDISKNAQAIPEGAIRFRVIANSDTVADQWVKREVRNAVISLLTKWVEGAGDVGEARLAIRDHLPEISSEVERVLRENGFHYPAEVELGIVPFPTKKYGNLVYPAGEYEAVRIQLGEGLGDNWWCVLFPPLCFIDMSSGEAVRADSLQPDSSLAEPGGRQTEKTPDLPVLSHRDDSVSGQDVEKDVDENGTQDIIQDIMEEKLHEDVHERENEGTDHSQEDSASSVPQETIQRPEVTVELKFLILEWISALFA